jgi:hypothetical protein
MAEDTLSTLSRLTEFFSSEESETTARRTGFVKRTSKITGKLFLALVTFGLWSDAKTTLAQLAAKVTQLGEQLEVSPEAIHQRMNKSALVFLQETIRQALATVQSLEKVREDGLFASFRKVYIDFPNKMCKNRLKPKKGDEMISLDDVINTSKDAREVKRALSVKMLQHGITPAQIGSLLNVSVQYVSKWKAQYEAQGAVAFSLAYKGKEKYLNPHQAQEILQWIQAHTT